MEYAGRRRHGFATEGEPNNPNEEGEDLISDMPDEIIQQILTLLPIKEAIQTSVLSKRWEFLWASMPTLSLVYTHQWNVPFIERTLMNYRASGISKFILNVTNVEFWPHFDSWIYFARLRQAKEISLRFSECYYLLPLFLYDHSFLVELSLHYCLPQPPISDVSWKRLKELSLTFIWVMRNETFSSILSGSPLLEYLHIDTCCDFAVKRIASTSLKRLEIYNCTLADNIGHVMEIWTPRLEYLTLGANIDRIKVRLMDVSSLLEAALTFDKVGIHCYQDMTKIMEKLHHVRRIDLGMWFIRLLLTGDVEWVSLSTLKWETMTLHIWPMRRKFHTLLDFIKLLHGSRKLTIHLRYTYEDYDGIQTSVTTLPRGSF